MGRRLAVVFAVVAAATSAGCYSYKFSGSMQTPPPAAKFEAIDLFAYDASVDVPHRFHGKTEKRDKFTMREIKWAVKDFPEMKHDHAKGYFYEPADPGGKMPCLVVLPPTGGPFDLVKGFAEYYAKRGFVVVAMRRRESFFNPDYSIEYNEFLIRQAVIDARRAIDYLHALDYVDKDKTCVMGISLGGIIGALTMETDARVKAAGFLVSTGHLSDVLMTSGFGRVAKMREVMMVTYGVGPDELRDRAEKDLARVDPVTYTDRLDPARVVMVNAAFDDILKREVVMKTREDYGDPQSYFMPLSHYTSIGFSGYANKKIYRHFARVLDL
ncbi:MAG: hypothetical protein M5R36_24650 [Deltaproteobacteria bacterium]|nr:hypothetical protein [Deltaproteobacteria bacterium]